MINWFNKQLDWLKSIFSEPSGGGSSKRVIGFILVYIFAKGYFATPVTIGEMIDVPQGWIFLISITLGVTVLKAAMDKFGKNKDALPEKAG